MPGVDIFDAFAELVVCVVFNLPHDQPRSSSSSSDDESLVGASSSGTTQIFSRVNSMEDSRSPHLSSLLHGQTPSRMSPNTHEVAAFTAANANALVGAAAPQLSQRSSTHSVDLYPGGIWNPLARLQPPAAAASSIAAPIALLPTAVTTCGSRPGSDVSTPRSSGPSTDRSGGLWSRLLGGSGVLQTPPRTGSYNQLPNTGMTTTASSYVQLTEEDLGMMNASGRVGGGMSGWTGLSTPASLMPFNSPHHPDGHGGGGGGGGGDSRSAATPSGLSTPLYEASPGVSCTQLPQQQQQQQQQQVRLNAHGLYVADQRSTSPQDGQSQASSSSEFVVL